MIWERLLHIFNTLADDFVPRSTRMAWRKNNLARLGTMREQMTFIKVLTARVASHFRAETEKRVNLSLLGLLAALVGITAVSLILVSPSATAEFELPPRDTPITEVTTTDTFGVPVGVRIHLQGEFVESWPWDTLHWQEDLWHVIEWQDDKGEWVNVDGWHGKFDTIFPEETRMVAQRELWATNDHLGTGPFRWKVYYGENGRWLQTSDPFNLPTESGDVVNVRLELWPR